MQYFIIDKKQVPNHQPFLYYHTYGLSGVSEFLEWTVPARHGNKVGNH